MQHIKTQSEWEAEMAEEILALLRSEIYLSLRYLDTALMRLVPVFESRIRLFAADGEKLFVNPEKLLELWKKNALYTRRAYLHALLHCVFLHLWTRESRTREEWGLACDIAVERVIDTLKDPAFLRPLSWTRQKTYRELDESGCSSPGSIYEYIEGQEESERNKLFREFVTDDHRYWPDERQLAANPSAGEEWRKIGSEVKNNLETHGTDAGDGSKQLLEQIRAEKEKRDYRSFLRKFASLREEPVIDPDSFDVGMYTYGLSVYGNLPLIEPLESREEMRIGDFVIAIDTSFSTSGKLVESFLRETFSVLLDSGIFSGRCRILLLQSDDAVREENFLSSRADMERLMHTFTLSGGGGTDFRPAFLRIYQLMEEGKINLLRGMLYFTDGKGTYPKKRPPWKTAFVFADERSLNENEERLPLWAMRIAASGLPHI